MLWQNMDFEQLLMLFYKQCGFNQTHFSCLSGTLTHGSSRYYKTYAKKIRTEKQIFRSTDFLQNFQH